MGNDDSKHKQNQPLGEEQAAKGDEKLIENQKENDQTHKSNNSNASNKEEEQDEQKCITLTTITYMCDNESCPNIYIPSNQARFVCATCSPIDNTFDLCETCVRDHDASHTLIVMKAPLSSSSSSPSSCNALTLYPSLAESLANRFVSYGGLKFIGTLNMKDPKSLTTTTETISHMDAYDYVTYHDIYIAARTLATNLQQQLLEDCGTHNQHCFVGLVGETSLCAKEWITVDMACVFADVISLPFPIDFAPECIESVLCENDVKVVFCSPKQADKIRLVCASSTMKRRLTRIIVFGSDLWKSLCSPLPEDKWSNLPIARLPSDIRTLFFTSGSTTGRPKGTIITDAMLNDELAKIAPMGLRADFVFQPMEYSAQRHKTYQNISSGGRLNIFSGSMDTFFEELKLCQPTGFGAPPRIWSLLYAKYTARVEELSLLHLTTPPSHIERMVQDEICSIFGPICRGVGTGGAITQPHLFQWMKDTFEPRMIVTESYGCTECGTIAVDGVKCHDVQVHLESIPELGYEVDEDGNGRGLLWVHTGREQSRGYFRDDEQTRQYFRTFPDDNGSSTSSTNVYYNTGDIVEYNSETKRLRVIDRIKNVLRLSSALFVSPEHLEGIYYQCSLVESIFVYAESDRDFVVAVVVPSGCSFSVLQQRHGGDASNKSESGKNNNTSSSSDEQDENEREADERLKTSILTEFRTLGARANVRPNEIPRAILIEQAEQWTVDNGMMISNFKLNRLALTSRYKDALHRLYQEVDGGGSNKNESNALAAVAGEEATMTVEGDDRSSDSFRDALCTVLQTKLCPSLDITLNEIGVDSVSAVHLQTLLDGIGRKPPLDMLLSSSLNQIKEFVFSSRDCETCLGAGQVDWEAETKLPEDILPTVDLESKGKVFLTGATGFLGIFILAEVLNSSIASVFAHLRAVNEEEGYERLKKNASSHCLDIDWDRVEVVCGDLSLPLLGMKDFSRIMTNTSLVIHCGAHVNALLPYNALRDVNVKSTVECLRFRRKLIYVSSLSAVVQSDDFSEHQSIQPLSLKPLNYMKGYGASKRVSEILLSKATSFGCKCVIVRPGTIGGSASTGSYNLNDTIPRFLQGCSFMSCAPCHDDIVINALDVRLVACIVVRARDGLYHARGHDGLTISQIGQALRVRLLPPSEWRRILWLSGPENPLFPLKETYFSGSGFPIGHDVDFDDSRAVELVKDRLETISPHLTTETIVHWAQWFKQETKEQIH